MLEYAAIDTAFLRAWIQPQHLDEGALRGYQEAFAAHPGRLVVLQEFLVESIARRLNTFLAAEAEFRVEFGLYSRPDQAVGEELWQAAADEDRFFRYGRMVAVRPDAMMSPNALTYLRFRQVFQDARFRVFFEVLTGLSLGSSDDFGSHAMGVGDFLRDHSDDNRNRRVAIVIYLSPDWQARFGGALHFVIPSGKPSAFDATFNQMVAFDVQADTSHYVGAIEPAAGPRVRHTIGGWYPNGYPPDG